MPERRTTARLSQKEHAQPNFLIQNVLHNAETRFAARMGDCGIWNRRQLLFVAQNGVDLNLGTFLIDHGPSHHGLQEWASNMGSRSGRMLERRSRRQESTSAFAEGVTHWIDLIEFWFLLHCLLPWLRFRVARKR